MKKLRLLLFEACNRNCEGCCNKQWDLEKLPVATSYAQFGEVCLTGGEPMLSPECVASTAQEIRKQNYDARIYLYTAMVDDIDDMFFVMPFLDGITVTLHEQKDVKPFIRLTREILKTPTMATVHNPCFTLRVNIFKSVTVKPHSIWIAKKDMEWIADCPLPDGEVFMRIA